MQERSPERVAFIKARQQAFPVPVIGALQRPSGCSTRQSSMPRRRHHRMTVNTSGHEIPLSASALLLTNELVPGKPSGVVVVDIDVQHGG
jgi:hypothetical protein